MKILKYLFFGFLFVSNLWSCEKNPVKAPVKEKKEYSVLFIGNSYTYYNDGVDYHLQRMMFADTADDSTYFVFQKIATGSYTLEAHYGDQSTLNKVNSRKWTNVVLQEQSTRPINNPLLFSEFAAKLDTVIKKVNAKTVLYMTWATKDQPTDIVALAASYNSVGSQLNALVVPVGKVWEYTQNTYPQVGLFISDNKHPTLAGTYLTVCVFYYSLFGKNPVNNTYVPIGMNAGDVITIRKAVNDYMKQTK
jgi:hypothetical protein